MQIKPYIEPQCLSSLPVQNPAFKFTPTFDLPKFNQEQQVLFFGGQGTVKNCHPDSSGTWTYIIEMELGPEPELGRLGSEASLILYEVEIEEITKP
jgi:hypothetical protein